MRHINKIIIHCTATAEGKDYTVDQIRGWHTRKGWSDIGYHYLVYRDGTVHEGRPVERMGAHVRGYNANSIGISYIGGVEAVKRGDKWIAKDTRTDEQLIGLDNLLKQLMKEYPDASLHGHNEFSSKSCPCFDVQVEYDYLIDPQPIRKRGSDSYICKRGLHRFND